MILLDGFRHVGGEKTSFAKKEIVYALEWHKWFCLDS